jgi:glycolate oxidase FAD binding subunit
MTAQLNRFEDLRTRVRADLVDEHDGKIVALPRTTEEVAAILRHADENRLTVEIVGGGTKRGWGNPVSSDLVLETSAMAGVSQYSPQDLTVTVAAGTRWSAMQRALQANGQHVALDPLWPDIATVGGIIATNDSGSLRLKYGSLRDLVIGMTIVLADGTIARTGGKVVKNVAGYDLHKLMTGAFGTLGVIAEVTFRLHPTAAQTKTWTVSSPTAEPASELLLKVLDSQLSIQAMQLRTGDEGYRLDVELATLPEVLASQLEVLDRLAESVAAKSGVNLDAVPGTDANPFAAREQLFASPGGAIVKLTMLPSRIAVVSNEVVRLGGRAVTQATGIMFARFDEDAATAAIQRLRGYVESMGDGSLTVLRASQRLPNLPVDTTSSAVKTLPLMREIKRQFDPNRVLNPGRFLGGI